MKRLDAMAPRKYKDRDGNEKTAWQRVGAAFEGKNGGWNVILEVMPLPVDGQVRFSLFEPRENNGDKPARGNSGGGDYGRDDSDIPF